jgi:transcriptional regulator with XRE-family HTH domain
MHVPCRSATTFYTTRSLPIVLAFAHNACMRKGSEQRSEFGVRAGNRIKIARADRGWSQRELSEHTGNKLSSSRIANYEQGTREIGIQEAEILAKALHVQPGYVMGVTTLKTPLNELEEELVRNWRVLPENERDSYFKRIEALALAYRTPVADERLGDKWQAPQQPQQKEPKPKPKDGRRGRKKLVKQV